MYEYSHGGNVAFEGGREGTIDLSANMNPLGIPQGVQEAVIQEIPFSEYYPDSSSARLRAAIATYENVNEDWIICGNGASDLIFRLPRAIQAKKVLVTAPSFSDYERSARSSGARVAYHRLLEENGFALDDRLIDTVAWEKPDLVYLCSPNNPTGLVADPDLIQELLETCEDFNALVMVDECFLDFTQKGQELTSKRFLGTYQNLIILKAFTKIFSLPGIRLGYALTANSSLIDQLYFHGPDWSVSNLAQAAGIAALKGAPDFIARSVAFVTTERALLAKVLSDLGYQVFDSQANYLFLQNPYPMNLKEALDKKGIRIRSCGNYPGLDNSYYRIAIPKEVDKETVFAALEAVTQPYKATLTQEGSHQ